MSFTTVPVPGLISAHMMTEGLQMFPHWTQGDHEIKLLKPLVRYNPASEGMGRGTGWLYMRSEQVEWPESFAPVGAVLLSRLRAETGTDFSAACYQAYMDGVGVNWHADKDWDAQAILSLGVTRTFWVRNVNGGEYSFPVNHGDLLIMLPGFQDLWEHAMMAEDAPGERISIVFRSELPS